MVATGRVFNLSGDMLHNMPLLASHVHVAIDVPKDINYPLPIPTKDAVIIGEVMSSFVRWQASQVRMPSLKKIVKMHNPRKR